MSIDDIPISGDKNYNIITTPYSADEVPIKTATSYNIQNEGFDLMDPTEKPIGSTGAYVLPLDEFPLDEDTKEEETGPLNKRVESKS